LVNHLDSKALRLLRLCNRRECNVQREKPEDGKGGNTSTEITQNAST